MISSLEDTASRLLRGRLLFISIILNEYEWAKDALEEPDLRKHPVETLKLIARYYLDKGYDRKNVRDLLEQYILECDAGASIVLWDNAIESAIRQAAKRPAVMIDKIVLTKPEMECIENIKGRQAKRLAFTLLCLAKYWDCCRDDNNHWVTNKNADIMAMANISASLKRQGALYRQLEEEGLLHFPVRVDAISIQVLFMKKGNPEVEVKDFRNLGYQYLKYKGGAFFECEECGITTKIKNPESKRPQKYCASCAAKIHTQQKVNSVMKARMAT